MYDPPELEPIARNTTYDQNRETNSRRLEEYRKEYSASPLNIVSFWVFVLFAMFINEWLGENYFYMKTWKQIGIAVILSLILVGVLNSLVYRIVKFAVAKYKSTRLGERKSKRKRKAKDEDIY